MKFRKTNFVSKTHGSEIWVTQYKKRFFLLNIGSEKYFNNFLFLADFGILNGGFLKNVCYFYKWADKIKRPDGITGFDGLGSVI